MHRVFVFLRLPLLAQNLVCAVLLVLWMHAVLSKDSEVWAMFYTTLAILWLNIFISFGAANTKPTGKK